MKKIRIWDKHPGSDNNPSNLLIVRQRACIESFLPISSHFSLMKKSAKSSQAVSKDRLGRKDGGLRTYKLPSQKLGDNDDN
jgi:hypothetical protein